VTEPKLKFLWTILLKFRISEGPRSMVNSMGSFSTNSFTPNLVWHGVQCMAKTLGVEYYKFGGCCSNVYYYYNLEKQEPKICGRMYFDLPFCVKSVKRVKSVKLNFGNLFSVGNPFPDASKCNSVYVGN
jgi:hypothetical protein